MLTAPQATDKTLVQDISLKYWSFHIPVYWAAALQSERDEDKNNRG